MILNQIQNIPEEYSEVQYNHKKYSIVKETFNNGQSYKIYAEELGGKDFISLNYYRMSHENVLKPCEMPKEKVIHFLNNYQPIL